MHFASTTLNFTIIFLSVWYHSYSSPFSCPLPSLLSQSLILFISPLNSKDFLCPHRTLHRSSSLLASQIRLRNVKRSNQHAGAAFLHSAHTFLSSVIPNQQSIQSIRDPVLGISNPQAALPHKIQHSWSLAQTVVEGCETWCLTNRSRSP